MDQSNGPNVQLNAYDKNYHIQKQKKNIFLQIPHGLEKNKYLKDTYFFGGGGNAWLRQNLSGQGAG